ncbi:hypothetical protein [Streptomyces sp.]|uniref:hypothetical protein n=1 Tax=Streptomyces sp. TaxID=1931 RepID=UPI002D77238C|nr:hypothetical protein [Streptomyces sp.]HET6354880.1 hypothetical protein [Streptomyces sp.]
MARTKPSRLELTLIAEVEEYGYTVTATQLERWRQRLWLPRTNDWRGPDGSAVRPEIMKRAIDLAKLSAPGRSISWGGWVFWALDDTPESAEPLREALLAAMRRPLERAGVDVGQVPAGDSDAAFEAREELAAQLLRNRRSPRRDLDGSLRAHAAEAGVELPPPRSVPNLFHRSLTEPGSRMMVGGAADVSFEGLMDSWEATWPEGKEMIERIRAAHREAELTGVDLMAQSPMANGLLGLMQAVEQADDRLLCAAVRACTKASGTLAMVWTRAVEKPEIVPQLKNDVMWDQWVRVGGLAPFGAAGEAAVAINTVQYLVVPGWADDLHRYQAFMDHLLLDPPGARPSA